MYCTISTLSIHSYIWTRTSLLYVSKHVVLERPELPQHVTLGVMTYLTVPEDGCQINKQTNFPEISILGG